jgi:phytoene dehydrogenase-like protein
MSDDNSYDAIVIGAGISGLLSALVLSKKGKRVLIVDKESFIGGMCRSYDVEGYMVDTGPHVITRLDSGPLKELMDNYFDVVPSFVPHGTYHVRINERVKPFPWSVRDWMLFDLLPLEDRSLMMKTAFDIVYMLSVGKDLSRVSIADVVPRNLSRVTNSFLDYLSHFMLGTSVNDAPISRFVDRKEYNRDKLNENNSLNIPYVGRLYNLLIGGKPSDQMYPKGGIQKIVDSIKISLPKNAHINLNENLISIDVESSQKNGQAVQKVCGIKTDKNEYKCDTVIYSGFPNELPEIIKHDLPVEYVQNMRNIEQVKSLTVWLGLEKEVFTEQGSEMWVSPDPSGLHTWVVPTSNFDPYLAPKGNQLVGFAFIVPENTPQRELRDRALDTIFTTMPEIENCVDMIHHQELVPEKACWSINSGFSDVVTPVKNLYCVGSSTVKRSMGVTRSAYSVLRMMNQMAIDRNGI